MDAQWMCRWMCGRYSAGVRLVFGGCSVNCLAILLVTSCATLCANIVCKHCVPILCANIVRKHCDLQACVYGSCVVRGSLSAAHSLGPQAHVRRPSDLEGFKEYVDQYTSNRIW